MSVKVGINGFGRIGRPVLKFIEKDPNMEVVHINDLTSPKTLAHLFKYDSVHGQWDGKVESTENSIKVNGREIKISAERDPKDIPWKAAGVDIVFECTGLFKEGAKLKSHMDAGAKKVLLSVPGKNIDATFVLGVNDSDYDPSKHNIVSNASCTTNCLAPLAKVLNDTFGVKNGIMTTIHAYTNDQKLLDLPHSDLRRARAAAVNMIPTTTGAAAAVGLVLPELKGKLDGYAIRVPTSNVSVVDLTFTSEKPMTVETINAAVKEAANGPLKGVLQYVDLPLVSGDFNGDTHSSSFDSLCTNVSGDHVAKVVSWYDNETGYAKRLTELGAIVAKSL
jgi:glyceraldehyde 3-phosphate dehydrogenase